MKKLNINKETLVNGAMFIGGLSLLVTSARVKDDEVVWNMLKAVPAELLMIFGLMNEGRNDTLMKINNVDLYDSEGNEVELKIERTPFLKKFKK